MLDVRATDDTGKFIIAGAAIAVRPIPGLIRPNRPFEIAASGRTLHGRRMPVTSDQIIVNNPSGSITIRLIDVQADGVMVGVIERLEPLENFPQGEEHIGLRAIVKVPGAEYVATLIPC